MTTIEAQVPESVLEQARVLAEIERAADALTPEQKQALSSRSAPLHCQP